MSVADRKLALSSGVASAVLANLFLGLSSLYWKAFGYQDALIVVSYRAALSLFTVALVLYVFRSRFSSAQRLTVPLFMIHCVASILLAVNWYSFIWASIHGRVLESGLGYLIAPLISIVVGVVVYKEALSVIRALGILVIVISVISLMIVSTELDAKTYLLIGSTWGAYICLKKMTTLDVFYGLLVESAVISFLCMLLLGFYSSSIFIPVDFSRFQVVMLMGCGLVSIIPLALFSFAAKKMPLTMIGLLQFVLPVTQFAVGTLIYQQTLSFATFTVFVLVVFAVTIVMLESVSYKRFK